MVKESEAVQAGARPSIRVAEAVPLLGVNGLSGDSTLQGLDVCEVPVE